MAENNTITLGKALILILIILIGFLFRYICLPFNYPMITHTDEHAIVDEAITMADHNTMLSYQYERPDNGMKKALRLIYPVFSRIMTDQPNDSDGTIARLTDNGVEYNIVGRLYCMALGIALILCAFMIGRHFNDTAAFVMASGVSFLSTFIQHSVYVTSDISVTLALALCTIFALRYIEKPGFFNLLMMSLFGATGTLDKYPGILTCGMIAVVVIFVNIQSVRRILLHGIIAFAAYIAIMFVLSPNLFFDIKSVIERLKIENRSQHLGADGLGFLGNLIYYIKCYANTLGVSITVAAGLLIVSAVVMIIQRDRRTIAFSANLFWWLLLSTRALHWERWGVPMYFGWTVLIGYAFGSIVEWFRKLSDRQSLKTNSAKAQKRVSCILKGILAVCASVLFVICMYAPLTQTILNISYMRAKSTTVVASAVTEQLGCTETNSLSDPGTPLLPTLRSMGLTDKLTIENGVLYRHDSNVRFIIVNEGQQKQYLNSGYPEQYTADLEKYDWIEINLQLLDKIERKGGQDIHRIKLANALRRLGLAMMDEYTTGNTIKIYDGSQLFLNQTISAEAMEKSDLVDGYNYEFELGYLSAGTYSISTNSGVSKAAVESWQASAVNNCEYELTLTTDCENVCLTISADQTQMNDFEWVNILQETQM